MGKQNKDAVKTDEGFNISGLFGLTEKQEDVVAKYSSAARVETESLSKWLEEICGISKNPKVKRPKLNQKQTAMLILVAGMQLEQTVRQQRALNSLFEALGAAAQASKGQHSK